MVLYTSPEFPDFVKILPGYPVTSQCWMKLQIRIEYEITLNSFILIQID